MARLLVVAHAPLASALQAVAAHVYPECAGELAAIDVQPGSPAEAVEAQVREGLRAAGGGDVLILTDVFGATPCNAALAAADGTRARVVAGVNVPMLWRTLCYADEPLDALVARALAGATQGVLQATPTRPQQQARGAGEADAKGDRQDQQ